MSDSLAQALQVADGVQLCRGEVVAVEEPGTVVVTVGDSDVAVRCVVLVTSAVAPPLLMPADQVLVWVPRGGGSPVVIGRIGQASGLTPGLQDPPDSLTIEAKHSLTLRVGDGSITIREDGKILIKGKDLVSHATRLNRIKGGAVQIN